MPGVWMVILTAPSRPVTTQQSIAPRQSTTIVHGVRDMPRDSMRCLVALMSDHAREDGEREVVQGADADVRHDEVEEDVDAGADFRDAFE